LVIIAIPIRSITAEGCPLFEQVNSCHQRGVKTFSRCKIKTLGVVGVVDDQEKGNEEVVHNDEVVEKDKIELEFLVI